jgi:serine/threonine protein kinase
LLAFVDEPLRSALVVELIRLDQYYLRRADETPPIEEYRSLARGLGVHIEERFWKEEVEGQRATSTSPADGVLKKGRRIGPYEILAVIKGGGMGVVYKARQETPAREVALKVIRPGILTSAEVQARFRHEANAVAGLDHPGIVPILEVGQDGDQPYYSMAFIEGPSLADLVREGPLQSREAARLMRAVAEAMQYSHDRGVIHRDLKPGNILLDRGQPRVTDFGLAKGAGEDTTLTLDGRILGTPSYMPPEQAAGRSREAKQTADIYSLGATL